MWRQAILTLIGRNSARAWDSAAITPYLQVVYEIQRSLTVHSQNRTDVSDEMQLVQVEEMMIMGHLACAREKTLRQRQQHFRTRKIVETCRKSRLCLIRSRLDFKYCAGIAHHSTTRFINIAIP